MAQGKDFKYSMGFNGVDKLSTPLGKIQKAMSKTSKELRSLRSLEKQFGQFKALRKNSSGTIASLKKAKAETAKLGKALSGTVNPTKKMTAEFKRAQKSVHALKLKQAKEIQELAKLGRGLRQAGFQTANMGSGQRKLKSDINRASGALDKQRRQLKKLSAEYRRQKAARDRYSKSLQTASNLGIVGASGVAVGTRTLRSTFGLVDSVRAQEANIGKLKSLGQTKIDIQIKGEIFDKIADQFAYIETPDLFGADYDVVSALGKLDSEAQGYITGYSAVLARATNANASEITDLATTAHGMFKGQSPDISDIQWMDDFSATLAASVTAFKTTGPKMQQAFQSAGPSAAAIGFTMEEYSAILGAGQKTMKDGDIGTAFASYADSVVKAQNFFEEQGLGIRLLDGDNKRRSITDVLEDFNTAFGPDWDAQELAQIQEAFGRKEAKKFMIAMKDANEDRLAGRLQIAGNKKLGMKSVTDMALRMDDNGDAEIQKAIEALRDMKRDLGYALLPLFLAMIPVLKSVTGWISDFAKNHKFLVGVIGTAVIAFGVFATVMGAVTLAMASMIGPFAVLKFAKTTMILKTGLLSKAMKGLGFAFKWVARTALPALITGMKVLARVFLLNPIGLAITAIAIGAFLIIKYWKPISGWFGRMFKKLKPLFAFTPLGLLIRGFGVAFKWLVTLIQSPGTAAHKTWTLLKTIFAWSPMGLMMQGIGKTLKFLRRLFARPKDEAKSTWEFFKILFAWSPLGLLQAAWGQAPDIFKAIFDAINAIAVTAMQGVTDSILAPLKLLRDLKNKLTGKKGVPISRTLKHGGSALKSGLGVGVLAAATVSPAFANATPFPPFVQPAPSVNSAAPATQSIVINIKPSPGMDERALARLVASKLAELDRKKQRNAQGSLSDIGD